MSSTRRDFLRASATVAAGTALGPLANSALAAAPASPAAPRVDDALIRARPLALERVRVTGGPLKHAQDITAKYLLELDPDRMMSFYRVRAGLPKKGEPYGGWDGGGRNLTGHIAGHHLSAVSYMFLATGDERFKERAAYLVRELDEVQRANRDGYLGALENGREAFAALSRGEIRSAAFDLNGLWSPWYTLHKTFAGLRDAYRSTGNQTALSVERRYAEWAASVLAPLDEWQLARMLNTEHGGMNEVLVDLWVDTGDTRWLDLSRKFEHHAFTDALKRHQDNLAGKHGNCQIPKLIGSATRYRYTGDTGDILAASFFWDRVAQHHSYATGGHGLAEYFGEPDKLSARVDGRTCESCNEYNMLKLTRLLFALRPDAAYADYYERALFNHVLASIDPEDGRTSYMVPVGRGVQQEYQNMQQSFTCCVGTGMENHALHGAGIYFESPDMVWVNLFVPSTARLDSGETLTMDSSFPDGDTATLTVGAPRARTFTLAIRRPAWAGDTFAIKVNGAPVALPTLASLRPGGAGGRDMGVDERRLPPSSYVELSRAWTNGDVVEVTIPKSLRLEPTLDNRTVTSIMWGPLVLAGDHGARREGRGATGSAPVIPALVAANKPFTDWLKPTSAAGDFVATGVAAVPGEGRPAPDLSLAPFHRTHRRVYSTYFDLVSRDEFAAREAALATERERVRRLEAATIGFVQPGDAEAEKAANYQGQPADRQAPRTNGRGGRGGAGWFSYDIRSDAAEPVTLAVTYFNELGLPPGTGEFQILVDGTTVATVIPDQSAIGFYDAQYRIPESVTRGKTRITVKFQATEKGRIAPVYGVRIARTNSL